MASSVVVAVAVGTPGIGYVNTGLFATQATVVFPIVITSAASRWGLGVIGGALKALNKFEWFANQIIRRFRTGNVPYATGMATALTLDALGLDPRLAETPPEYLRVAEQSRKAGGKFTARPDQDFQQGVAEAIQALASRGPQLKMRIDQFYMECAKVAVVNPHPYSDKAFAYEAIRNWSATTKKLAAMGYNVE